MKASRAKCLPRYQMTQIARTHRTGPKYSEIGLASTLSPHSMKLLHRMPAMPVRRKAANSARDQIKNIRNMLSGMYQTEYGKASGMNPKIDMASADAAVLPFNSQLKR